MQMLSLTTKDTNDTKVIGKLRGALPRTPPRADGPWNSFGAAAAKFAAAAQMRVQGATLPAGEREGQSPSQPTLDFTGTRRYFPTRSRHRPIFSWTARSEKLNSTASSSVSWR